MATVTETFQQRLDKLEATLFSDNNDEQYYLLASHVSLSLAQSIDTEDGKDELFLGAWSKPIIQALLQTVYSSVRLSSNYQTIEQWKDQLCGALKLMALNFNLDTNATNTQWVQAVVANVVHLKTTVFGEEFEEENSEPMSHDESEQFSHDETKPNRNKKEKRKKKREKKKARKKAKKKKEEEAVKKAEKKAEKKKEKEKKAEKKKQKKQERSTRQTFSDDDDLVQQAENRKNENRKKRKRNHVQVYKQTSNGVCSDPNVV